MTQFTDAQLQTWADHINANTDQDVIDAVVGGDDVTIRNHYNGESADFHVWHDIDFMDLKAVLDWVEYSGKTDKSLLIWSDMREGGIPLTSASVRSAILNEIFKNEDNRNVIIDAGKRLVTVIESVFATGTGTFADPADVTISPQVDFDDVQAVRAFL